MNTQKQFPIHTLTQGRNAGMFQQKPSPACLNHRSLSSWLRRTSSDVADFASLRLCVKWFVLIGSFLLATLAASISVAGQEVAETIRIKTRVVFLDALVKDKRTGIPISDLAAENFEVLDDGKPRTISYFTKEGQARKPLALILVLDLRDDGAGRFLKRPEIIKAMSDELAKLPPQDEVAVLVVNANTSKASGSVIRDGKAVWISEFTKDRAQLANSLAQVPNLVDTDENAEANRTQPPPEEAQPSDKQTRPSDKRSGMTISADTDKRVDDPKSPTAPKPDEVLETETIQGKNGAKITRTVMKDGSINVARVNKSGHVQVELDDIYDLPAAVRDSTQYAQKQRPNSQTSIVWVSDGIVPIFFEDRDATEQLLVRDNVIFNSLTVDLRTLFKFLMPIAKPIGGWLGMSLYGSAKRMAQQTGGEAVKVNRAKDYGIGLSRIVGNLTARYSLGFALDEAEKDDGRLHNLEVKVKAQDQKGKTRKLDVSARKGYYMTLPPPQETAAQQDRNP
jgi:VWFA-related protein